MGNIHFSIQNNYNLNHQSEIERWLMLCVANLHKDLGEINVALMSDNDLLLLNQKHLNHDYYTDVITFDYSFASTIHCDIAVSTDRVEDNAKTHNVPIQEELRRVLIHGILHCCDFTDKTKLKETEMRLKENELLMLFHVEPNPTSDV